MSKVQELRRANDASTQLLTRVARHTPKQRNSDSGTQRFQDTITNAIDVAGRCDRVEHVRLQTMTLK